jgi:myo-inositol-1(or 4)-monophosphatase
MPTGTGTDWLAVCRRATAGVRTELERFPDMRARSVTTGRGEGGDIALVIDRAAEDAIFRELEEVGLPLTVISEERGHVDLNGGGTTYAVVDPIDGSRNARRGIPGFSVSIAIASGGTLADVEFGYVCDLTMDEEWHAAAGEGAYLNEHELPQLSGADRLEMLALEMAMPDRLVGSAEAIAAAGADRIRALGSLALSICWVAGGRYDALASLAKSRSVDFAAAQLLVTEAGGVVETPEAGEAAHASLDLTTRTRILAAASPAIAERLRAIGAD